MLIMLLLF